MKHHTIHALALSIFAGVVMPAMANTISVRVPSPVTGDPVPTGVTLKAGHTYTIKTNVTIIPKEFKSLSVLDPLSVVRSTGGMPLATIDGLAVANSLNGPPLSPVTLDLSLPYTPSQSYPLCLRLLNAPEAITFNSIGVDAPTIKPPAVKVKTKKLLPNGKLTLKGSASGDDGVGKIVVAVNGKPLKAKGTTSWTLTTKLKPGKSTITITAYDLSNQASVPKKLAFMIKKP